MHTKRASWSPHIGLFAASWVIALTLGLLATASARTQPASDVEAGRLSIDTRGGLSLYGGAFRSRPAQSAFTPRRLTLWVPKGMTLLGGKVKACTKAKVRKANHPDGLIPCQRVGTGRLNSSNDITGWYAVAGPKQGKKRLIWMRAKNGDQELTGFGTGTLVKASGAYSSKLVLRYSGLDLRVSGMETLIGSLRKAGKCPGAGWPFKLTVVAAEGTDSVKWRAKCGGGGGGGGGGRDGGGGGRGGGRP
jgi:hypothetical protein